MMRGESQPFHIDFLNQPSPYHDDAPTSSRPSEYPAQPSTMSSKAPFLKKLRFVPVRSTDEEDDEKSEGTVLSSLQSTPYILAGLCALLIFSTLINLLLWLRTPYPTELTGGKGGMKCVETYHHSFEPDTRYANVYHSSDHLWKELQGGSEGVVFASEGREDGKVRLAGLSMFHQLHCLNGFRSAIQQLQEGKKIGFSEDTDVSMHRGHWHHCFDYLRQVILCNADDTIELSHIDAGQWSINGYNTPRQCKDKKKLLDMTACGEAGCPGTKFYRSPEEMKRINEEMKAEAKAHTALVKSKSE